MIDPPNQMRLLIIIYLQVCCLVAASASDDRVQPSVYLLTEGVVVDQRSGLLYAMRPKGGIEAVDLESGSTRWVVTTADKPLTVSGGRLLAQKDPGRRRGVLLLSILDLASGDLESALEVPLGVNFSASVDRSSDRSFTISAWPGPGGAVVCWSHLRQELDGAWSSMDNRKLQEIKEGWIRVDFAQGIATFIGSCQSLASNKQVLSGSLRRLQATGQIPEPIWWSGDLVVALEKPVGENNLPRLVLRRWLGTTGKALPPITLQEGESLLQVPSVDRQHLLVSRRKPAKTDRWLEYLWSIYSMATGEKIGEIQNYRSASPFLVLNSTILIETLPYGRRESGRWLEHPRKVHALDLVSGNERWSREIRDPLFSGPRPPAK